MQPQHTRRYQSHDRECGQIGLNMIRNLLVTLGLVCLGQTAVAQDAQPYEFPFQVDVYDLPIASNGVAYRLYVRAPLAAEDRADGPPGIFYVLDGNYYFPALAAGVFNTEHFGHTPNAYMVGIGYADLEELDVSNHRTSDYTPTRFSPPDANHPLPPHDYEGSGGAADFLRVLEEEIIPFVEARYALDNSERGLVGKSYGGLFASYAFLQQPDLFSQYVIISPSLWWDDFMLPHDERAMMQMEADTHDMRLAQPTRIVFTAGSLEERLGMVTDVTRFTERLAARQDPNLDFTYRVLEGEQHESMFPRAVMTSFRLLQGTLDWDDENSGG